MPAAGVWRASEQHLNLCRNSPRETFPENCPHCEYGCSESGSARGVRRSKTNPSRGVQPRASGRLDWALAQLRRSHCANNSPISCRPNVLRQWASCFPRKWSVRNAGFERVKRGGPGDGGIGASGPNVGNGLAVTVVTVVAAMLNLTAVLGGRYSTVRRVVEVSPPSSVTLGASPVTQ